MTEQADRIVHRCRCDAIVRAEGVLCPACEDADLEELGRHTLGRQLDTPPEPASLPELFEKVGRIYGFERSVPADQVVHRCRCDAIVETRGSLCLSCAQAEIAELRRMAIDRARRTLPAWEHARFDSPRFKVDERLRDQVREWRMSEGDGLTILGPTGKGKSTLGIALCVDRMDRATTIEQVKLAAGIRYVLASELDRARAQHALGRDEAPLVKTAIRATVLFLDDLGKERTDGSGIRFVLEKRYVLGRANLITSELRLAQLGERYGLSDRRRVAERVIVASCHQEKP